MYDWQVIEQMTQNTKILKYGHQNKACVLLSIWYIHPFSARETKLILCAS